MNTIVSAAAVASATAILNPVLTRAEQMVEALRNHFTAPNVPSFDEIGAARVVDFFRDFDVNQDDDDRFATVVDFFDRYNQSLDWVILGNPGGLICEAAERSSAIVANDPVFVAIAEHRKASEEYDRLMQPDDEPPGVDRAMRALIDSADRLFFTSQATTPGGLAALLAYMSTLKEWEMHGDLFSEFEREATMQKLFKVLALSANSCVGVLPLAPSSAASVSDEVIMQLTEDYIAAWQHYRHLNNEVDDMDRTTRGYKARQRALVKAERAYNKIEKEIANTRATTVAGLYAKVRCALAYAISDHIEGIETGSCEEVMAMSIFEDLERLATQGTGTIRN